MYVIALLFCIVESIVTLKNLVEERAIEDSKYFGSLKMLFNPCHLIWRRLCRAAIFYINLLHIVQRFVLHPEWHTNIDHIKYLAITTVCISVRADKRDISDPLSGSFVVISSSEIKKKECDIHWQLNLCQYSRRLASVTYTRSDNKVIQCSSCVQ